jgi:hypothetical protein
MRTKRIGALVLAASLSFSTWTPLLAGGRLETFDITGYVPSPIPGHIVARLIGMQWDVRTIPVSYSLNHTMDPIPNPLGAAFLSLAQARVTLQAAVDRWNAIPTSFIEMNVTRTTGNLGRAGFDFVNELTFRTAASFNMIASSYSTTLIADVCLEGGEDIDGDGDSDVSAAIATAQDVDHDGDIEFPAGCYKAGTILDNDVQFNVKASNGFRFTVADADLDTVSYSADLLAVAVHEFGHSHGLSHVLNNNKSATDGREAAMFPFIDTGDPAAQLAIRTLDSDDIAMSSLIYPEGTAASGPAALQPGDVAFSAVYGRVTGEVRHGVFDEPLAGASVAAINRQTGELVGSAFSGTTQLSYDPATGGLYLVSPAFNVLDGRYEMALPKGNYSLQVDPVDGNPVPAGSINYTAQVGSFLGQHTFNRELYNGNKEDALEKRAGEARNVPVVPGKTNAGNHIVTNATVNINNFGSRDFVGFTGASAGFYYVVRVPGAQLLGAAPADFSIHSAQFETIVVDSSTVPRFAEAMLTTGRVDPYGNIATIDLAEPLERAVDFVGAEIDFGVLFVKNPHETGRRVRRGLANGEFDSLFLVLRVPLETPFPGVNAFPPLIGLDGGVSMNDAPIFGLSFTSADGVTFARYTTFNFRFSLVLSETVP